jgi:hypothetical protein
MERRMTLKRSISLLAAGCTLFTLTTAFGANVPNAFKLAGQLLPTPERIEFTDAGIGFAKDKWIRETEGRETELFTSKGTVQGRVAVLRGKDGKTESLTAYKLNATKKDAPTEEIAASMIFDHDQLAAYSTCEDRPGNPAGGRTCVTATPKLCHALKDGTGVTPEILAETDTYEMRGLAVLLTLRGSDHQLDNMVRTGNRLGLKTALQTTKGQIMALARQLMKEQAVAKTASAVKAPAQRDPAAAKIVVSSKEEKAKEENEMAREVLERSLPRLKQACLDTKFN